MRLPRALFRPSRPLLLVAAAGLAGLTGCQSDPTPASARSEVAIGPTDGISIDWQDADLRELLERVGHQFGLRLDYPPDLEGRTSIRLRDVTWRQIFKVVLSPIGYDFYEDEGVVRIRPAEEIRALPPITLRVRLHHQSPDAVVRYLRRLDPALGALAVAEEDGVALVVHPTKAENIRAHIIRIDAPDARLGPDTPPPRLPATLPASLPPPPSDEALRASVTTEIFLLKHLHVFDLRSVLEMELAKSPHARVQPDVRVNLLVVTAPEAFMPRLRAIIEYLDDPRWLVTE